MSSACRASSIVQGVSAGSPAAIARSSQARIGARSARRSPVTMLSVAPSRRSRTLSGNSSRRSGRPRTIARPHRPTCSRSLRRPKGGCSSTARAMRRSFQTRAGCGCGTWDSALPSTCSTATRRPVGEMTRRSGPRAPCETSAPRPCRQATADTSCRRRKSAALVCSARFSCSVACSTSDSLRPSARSETMARRLSGAARRPTWRTRPSPGCCTAASCWIRARTFGSKPASAVRSARRRSTSRAPPARSRTTTRSPSPSKNPGVGVVSAMVRRSRQLLRRYESTVGKARTTPLPSPSKSVRLLSVWGVGGLGGSVAARARLRNR